MDIHAQVPKGKGQKDKSLLKEVGHLDLKAENPRDVAILTVLWNEWLIPWGKHDTPKWLIALFKAAEKRAKDKKD